MATDSLVLPDVQVDAPKPPTLNRGPRPDGDITFSIGGKFFAGWERFELQAPAGSAADIECPCVIREDPTPRTLALRRGSRP
jgi:hypothetical protein